MIKSKSLFTLINTQELDCRPLANMQDQNDICTKEDRNREICRKKTLNKSFWNENLWHFQFSLINSIPRHRSTRKTDYRQKNHWTHREGKPLLFYNCNMFLDAYAIQFVDPELTYISGPGSIHKIFNHHLYHSSKLDVIILLYRKCRLVSLVKPHHCHKQPA